MIKFYEATTNKYFEFSLLDETLEFKEFFSSVIEFKNTLIFTYKKQYKKSDHKILQYNIRYYYIDQRGWKKVKFLNY
jgi:hypothetical protein